MPRSLDLYLHDVLQAGESILEFTANKTLADHESDKLVRHAVERCFEIIGEALSQARSYHPDFRSTIDSEQKIIDFRNRVIHGYFDVDDAIVWSTSKVYLPPFLAEVRTLIAELRQMHPDASHFA